MGEHIATHILSITPDYCVHWTVWEAVRELLQNAIDQRTSDRKSLPFIEYDGHSLLRVGCTNCKLEPRSLLLGQTTKYGKRSAIGEHGEGYKLAMLTLARLSYEVRLHNAGELWIPSFVFSEEYQSTVLQIDRLAEAEYPNSVVYCIRDVDPQDWDRITENFLGFDHPMDMILDEDHLKGRVFVAGLWVCDVEGLRYGYNFSPTRLRLDRDRGLASTFDVAIASAQLWQKSGDHERLYDAVKARSLDTQYVRFEDPDVSSYVYDRYVEDHGLDTIPTSTDEEAERLQQTGHKVARVPGPMRDLLRRMHRFTFNRAGTPGERLERFQHMYGGSLTNEGKRELQSIVEASMYWTGPALGIQDEEDAHER